MTSFNIYKNVDERYSIEIPEFTESLAVLARFRGVAGFTVASPTATISQQIVFTSDGTIAFTATVTPISPVLLNDTTTASAKVTAMSHTGAGKVVTLTAPNNFNVGDAITVAGINAGFTVTNIDGSWTCETGTNATTVVFTVTSEPVGDTPQTITAGTIVGRGDCYILDPTTFLTSETNYPAGNYTVYAGDWSNSYPYKIWIPFVVDITKDTVIRLARLDVYGSSNGSTDGGNLQIRLGCENIGDAVMPTTFDELNLKTLTAGYTISIIPDISVWTAGTKYSYDITTAVQEILNHDDWVSSNTLGVLILDYGSEIDTFVNIASFDNLSYTAPTLVIIG